MIKYAGYREIWKRICLLFKTFRTYVNRSESRLCNSKHFWEFQKKNADDTLCMLKNGYKTLIRTIFPSILSYLLEFAEIKRGNDVKLNKNRRVQRNGMNVLFRKASSKHGISGLNIRIE